MSRLLHAELTRLRSRVLLWLAAAGVVAIAVVGVVGAWTMSTPPSQAEVDRAQANLAVQLDDWEKNGEQQEQDCRDAQAADPDPEADYGCDDMAPRLEWFLRPVATFAAEGVAMIQGMAVVLLAGALAIGASFVGAEFATGSIANWLTFAPRRGRVFASKLLATLLGMLPVLLVTAGVLVGGTYGAYALHDQLGAVTADTWPDLLASVGRMLVLGLGGAVIGVALGFLLRHTAAVLGALVGWFVAVEVVLRQVWAGIAPWTLATNVDAWVRGGSSYWLPNVCTSDASGLVSCESVSRELSMTHGGLYLAAVAAVLAVLALLVFRRRDVS